MELSLLEKVDDWTWRVRPGRGEPPCAEAVLHGDEALVRAMDDKVREQLVNVTRLPGIVGPALAMPDAHWGYGFPIGGVAAFDPAEGGVVSAGGVGFGISCGIRCLRTNLDAETVLPALPALVDGLFEAVPAGVGSAGSLRLGPDEIDEMLASGAEWAVGRGFETAADLEFVEERGRMAGAEPRFAFGDGQEAPGG